MDLIFLLGILGGLTLVAGAAWPVHAVDHPIKSTKNWLFAAGGLIMLLFSLLDYHFNGAPIFFVFLQILVNVSSVLMMANSDDRIDTAVIALAGGGLTVWSLSLFEDYSTIVFILGLVGIGIGYALENGTLKRNLTLVIGSILIAVFSYLGESWIFFWLNVFFAGFSSYWVIRLLRAR